MYICIYSVYMYTKEKRRGSSNITYKGEGILVRETKGKVEVNIWNVWVYLSELFHYIISFFNSKGGGGTTFIIPPTTGSANGELRGMIGTIRSLSFLVNKIKKGGLRYCHVIKK